VYKEKPKFADLGTIRNYQVLGKRFSEARGTVSCVAV
jgi:hypothetical protein